MRAAIITGLCGLLLAAGAASGQYLQFDAARRGHPLAAGRPSIRLTGMGSLGLVVPDEDNEINLSDFGGNLAGVARDKDGWSLESWMGRGLDLDQFDAGVASPGKWTDRFLQEQAAFDFVYRKGNRRALGLSSNWNGQTVTQPLVGNARVRGPQFGALWNENFDRLCLAVGLHRWSDNEDLVSDNVYGIRHYSASWRASLASAYLFQGWQVGGQLDLDRVRISGVSTDPSGFHLDNYKWIRPATWLRLTLLRTEPARLTGGLNLDWDHRTGNEEARISWSDRFPRNASRTNYSNHVPTFSEKQDSYGATARGQYWIHPWWNLACTAQVTQSTWKVTPAPVSNFPGSLGLTDERSDFWRVGGGTGYSLGGGRMHLGIEGYLWRNKDRNVLERSATTVRSRDAELRLGGEWLLPSNLAVRAGYVRGAYDANLDVDQSLSTRNGLSLGLGFVPAGGMVSLDLAFQVQRQKPKDTWSVGETTDTQNLAASVRFLF